LVPPPPSLHPCRPSARCEPERYGGSRTPCAPCGLSPGGRLERRPPHWLAIGGALTPNREKAITEPWKGALGGGFWGAVCGGRTGCGPAPGRVLRPRGGASPQFWCFCGPLLLGGGVRVQKQGDAPPLDCGTPRPPHSPAMAGAGHMEKLPH